MATSAEGAIADAARNNAAWCDAVARSHDAAGMFSDDLWYSERKLPPFYPNLITLRAGGEAAQRNRVAALIERGPPLPWAVKDSFARLDLTALGFECPFEARWIASPPDERPPATEGSSIRWHRVATPAALAAWEAAWRRDLPAGTSAIFRLVLLRDPAISFLAGIEADRIVAGCVLNLAAGAIGLSNLFGSDALTSAVWAGCREQARRLAPDLPIVGYEQAEALADAQAAGFRVLGPLRVWLKAEVGG
ncbi:hypothetical protein FRZ61_49910 [Hypericibacter adhaerens]|uniref:N-acetyltransferase domain-containing protein n=1 Tax=Hypericibacter adhaerens TaxID=2602016 RepID=A0A5J6NAU6_9PROT|nr:hypothetical protein [Hypericibacter adhaerens]QEX25046.1 hypothetical protein FRZ61_49910 [Hypericibacter adhaerens]